MSKKEKLLFKILAIILLIIFFIYLVVDQYLGLPNWGLAIFGCIMIMMSLYALKKNSEMEKKESKYKLLLFIPSSVILIMIIINLFKPKYIFPFIVQIIVAGISLLFIVLHIILNNKNR